MKTQCYVLMLACYACFLTKSFANGVAIVNGSQGTYLTLTSTNVQAEVHNQIVVVTTTQKFINKTGVNTPIRYGFPMHKEANAIELRWFVNGVWHKTIISKGTQHDSIPGGGNGEQLDPYLLQYLGDTPLMVTPKDSISPDSSITFVLKYVELLPYEFGIVRFEYPGDYTKIQWDVPVDEMLFTFHLQSDRTIEDIGMVNLVGQTQLEPNEATITFNQYEVPAAKDYHVYYQLSSAELGVLNLSTLLPDSLLHCDESGGGYLSLIIEPESNASAEVISKNFSLIIDRSGSMSGEKIIQARNAATFIVNELNYGDQFNIIDFASDVKSIFSELQPFSLISKSAALSYISKISAGGSTNISGALTTSIHQFEIIDTTKANIIIFFTDGMATAGVTNTEGILQAVQDAVNEVETEIYLFTFGIGSDVDKKLLTSLALENNGLAEFLGSNELEEKISRFFLKINNPVLVNTDYYFEPPIITDVFPTPLPNLYKGQQLILSGRYQEPEPVRLHLTGNAFNLPVHYIFDIPLADSNDVHTSFLPKIWAKQAIDHHVIDFNLAASQQEADQIQDLIDSISVCYGVISTEFTSFEDGGEVTAIYDETETVKRDHGISISITPNPVVDNCSIKVNLLHASYEDVIMVVMDSRGREVMRTSVRLNGAETIIDGVRFKDLIAGVYYLVFIIGDEVVTQQIIKK